MTQIDVARLSRTLVSLAQSSPAKPKAQATAQAGTASTRGIASIRHDPAILKSRLGERLRTLKKHNNFATAAPIITIQEVLRWEFGETIFQHPDFERIAGQVASALMTDKALKDAMESVIRKLSD